MVFRTNFSILLIPFCRLPHTTPYAPQVLQKSCHKGCIGQTEMCNHSQRHKVNPSLLNNKSTGGKIRKISWSNKNSRKKYEFPERNAEQNNMITHKNGVIQRITLCEMKQNESIENGLNIR